MIHHRHIAYQLFFVGSVLFAISPALAAEDSNAEPTDNTQRAKSYSLLSAKVGYRRDLGQHFRLDVYAGGNNLLGSLYYTLVFLNASYTGPAPNVYLPGPYSATFYGGVNLSYSP